MRIEFQLAGEFAFYLRGPACRGKFDKFRSSRSLQLAACNLTLGGGALRVEIVNEE